MRIGIVGAGAIAQLTHLPVLSKLRGVELAALCDNDLAKARSLAERFGVRSAYEDIDELLADGPYDLVVVATPNHLHESHVRQVLAQGTNVFCERPLSFAARGIEALLAQAKRTGAKVFVGNNHRFRADVQALANFLRGGELGAPQGTRAGAYHPHGGTSGWRLTRPMAGGGAFVELGWALLDLALWLHDFPTIARVHAHMHRPKGAKSVESAMLAVLETEDGATLTFDVSWAYVGLDERWWFEVLGSRGSARLNPLRVVKELNGRPAEVSPSGSTVREAAFLQSYRAQHAHVLAVLDGRAPYEPPEDQVTVARALAAIYAAAEAGGEGRVATS